MVHSRYITLLHAICLREVYETIRRRSKPNLRILCDCRRTVNFVRYNSSGRFNSKSITCKKRSILKEIRTWTSIASNAALFPPSVIRIPTAKTMMVLTFARVSLLLLEMEKHAEVTWENKIKYILSIFFAA